MLTALAGITVSLNTNTALQLTIGWQKAACGVSRWQAEEMCTRQEGPSTAHTGCRLQRVGRPSPPEWICIIKFDDLEIHGVFNIFSMTHENNLITFFIFSY